jgi:hypothetical protein
MRTKEKKMEKDNVTAIINKVGCPFSKFFGTDGQQHFYRVTRYRGFKFIDLATIDMTAWKQQKAHPECLVPNKRTKAGREMAEFLDHLQGGYWEEPNEILGVAHGVGSFVFTWVEIVGDIILIYLDDKLEPKDENVIEITQREFKQLTKNN